MKNPLFLAKRPGRHEEIFVRDYSTQRLVIFKDHDGDKLKYSHYICGQGNGHGKFQEITGIAASKDYLYVADCELHCIQKLQLPNGECVKQIGSHGSANNKFDMPYGIALDEAKSLLYVCDYKNHRIQVIENDEFSFSFGKNGTSQGCFNYPGDITMNSDKDELFITDLDNHRVQVFATSGLFLRMFGNVPYPFGIFYTHTQVVLISSVHKGYVHVYMIDAQETSTNTVPYSFACPCGVIMMDDEKIVVADMLGDKLSVI